MARNRQPDQWVFQAPSRLDIGVCVFIHHSEPRYKKAFIIISPISLVFLARHFISYTNTGAWHVLKYKLNEGLKSHHDLSGFQNVGLSFHVKMGPFL